MKKPNKGALSVLNMSQETFQTQLTTIRIQKEYLPNMNKQIHSFYKKFNDLQSRIAYIKSVKNLKEEFKRDSVTIKNWSPTYLLPEFEILLDSLAFAVKVYECGCYRKVIKCKNLTKHHCIKLIKPFGILQLLYLHRNEKKL